MSLELVKEEEQPKMKYYAAIFELTKGPDRAVLVKALDEDDAYQLVRNYTGKLKDLVWIIDPKSHTTDFVGTGIGNGYPWGSVKP